jgi:hypothetical protein
VADPIQELQPPAQYGDIALSARFADSIAAIMRYCATLDSWFVYKAACV